MNAGAIISDNILAAVSRESAGPANTQAESLSESPQQRFADDLAHAEAAQAARSENKGETGQSTGEDGIDAGLPLIGEQNAHNADGPLWRLSAKSVPQSLSSEVPPAGPSKVRHTVSGDAMADGGSDSHPLQPTEPGQTSDLPKVAHAPLVAKMPVVQAGPTGQAPMGSDADPVPAPAGSLAKGLSQNVPDGGESVAKTAVVQSPEVAPSASPTDKHGGPVFKEMKDARFPETPQAVPESMKGRQAAAGSEPARESPGPGAQADKPAPGVFGRDVPAVSATITTPASTKAQSVAVQQAPETAELPKTEDTPQGTRTDRKPQGLPERSVIGAKQGPLGEQASQASHMRIDGGTPPAQGGSTLSEASTASIGESTAFPQRPTSQPDTPVVSETVVTRSPTQSIGEQILDSVRASATNGDRQVLIRLQPPELGTVVVRFQEQGERIGAVLEVSSREARRDIELALPQVLRSLQEAGVQIRRFEVVPSDPPERDAGREHLQQDAGSQHQGTGQGRENLHGSPHPHWSQGMGGDEAKRQEAAEDEPPVAATPDRIDLLL